MLWSANARADDEAGLDSFELVMQLRDPRARKRKAAAEELMKRGPHPDTVAPLIAAAKVEPEEEVLEEMLLALGKSGAVEALGLLQMYAQAPVRDFRAHGREALKRWLVVNRVMSEDDDLPDPPHAFYGPPPRFSADRPAGRPIGGDPSEPNAPPVYEPPPPSGVPAGFRAEEVPHRGMVIGGAAVFGALYLFSVIGGSYALAKGGQRGAWMYLPVAGPLVLSDYAFNDAGLEAWSLFAGAGLILDGVGQLLGLTLFTAGFLATETVFVPSVAAGPGGARFTWTF